jgi:hypothetical protein
MTDHGCSNPHETQQDQYSGDSAQPGSRSGSARRQQQPTGRNKPHSDHSDSEANRKR